MRLATGRFASNRERNLQYRVRGSWRLADRLAVGGAPRPSWHHENRRVLSLQSPFVNSYHTIQTDCPIIETNEASDICAPRLNRD